MSTGQIVAVGATVVVVGGAVLYFVNKQQAASAAAAQAAAAQSAAARAAASAKNDFDIGRTLTDLGGHLIDKALGYAVGGPAGALAADAASSAVMV